MKKSLLFIIFLFNSAFAETSSSHHVDFSQTIYSLFVFAAILVLILISAMIFRRYALQGTNKFSHIQIIATLPLSTKEKIMLIACGKSQVLVGITPQGMNTLHVLSEPISVNENEAQNSFSDLLKNMLSNKDNS